MSIKIENIPMEMLELSVDDMNNVVGGATVKYIVFTEPDIIIGTPPKKPPKKKKLLGEVGFSL